MDICIYTTPEKLEHKKGGDGFEEYYWYLRNIPKRFKVGERIYFAVKGKVAGSFMCNEFNLHNDETICWNKNSWKPIDDDISTKPFQGFRYRWFDVTTEGKDK